MKINHTKFQRQGDVVLIPIKQLPANLEKSSEKEKVLQASETHGKFHRFHPNAAVDIYYTPGFDEMATTVTKDEGKFILVKEDSVLFHGTGYNNQPNVETETDHKSLLVVPGVYKVGIQRVYDYEQNKVRRVND